MSAHADFEAFARATTPRLLRTAYLLVGDSGHAEDLVQTTLERTARRWRSAQAAPVAYARAVLVNLVKDRARHRARRVGEAPLEGMPPTAGSVASPEDGVVLRSALVEATRALPERQRAVLVLRFFEDLSVAEVARVLGCAEGTVKSQTHAALARLRELLGEPTPDPDLEEADRAVR